MTPDINTRLAELAKEYARSSPRTSLQEVLAREDYLAGATAERERIAEKMRKTAKDILAVESSDPSFKHTAKVTAEMLESYAASLGEEVSR